MNLSRLACFLLAAILFSACKQKTKDPHRTVITGTVANRDNDTSITAFTLTVPGFGGDASVYTGKIQDDGTFKIVFEQFITQDVMLTPVVKKLITHPGDSIHIDLDLKDIGSAKFSGDAEKLNTDLFHYANEYYSTPNTDMDTARVRAGDISAIKSYCQNMWTELQNNRQEFIDKFNPDDELANWTKNYVDAQYYYKYGYLTIMHDPNMEHRRSPVKVLSGLPGFNRDMDDIFNSKLLCANAYELLMFLTPAPDSKTTKGLSQDQLVDRYMAGIARGATNEQMKEMLMAQYFYYSLKNNDIEGFDQHRKTFDANINTDLIKQPLLSYYEIVKHNTIRPEEYSKRITGHIKDTPAQGIIDSIKKEHQGKVIYIDVWATWCGPCKAEMPYSEKLAQKYIGKNVKFVYLCIDSKRGAWLKILQQLKLSGQQYYCDEVQSQSLGRGFGIQGIPYYMIIDAKGQIVDMGNHLRPSSAITEHKIDKLLHKS